MILETSFDTPSDAAPARKPRIALMGEFSAGKSSLTNLLLGGRALPVQVTATRLPPVHISYGEERAAMVDHKGEVSSLPLADIGEISVRDAQAIHVHLPSETLELCDLIDMPGISDPNMPSDIWEAVLPEIDSLLWCTPAPQAWRQSEAAFWAMVQPHLRAPATLVLTHIDKLLTARDRSRVERRVAQETGGDFGGIFPLSLTQAMAAGEDLEAWQNSGADRFVEHLVNQLLHWDDHLLPGPVQAAAPLAAEAEAEACGQPDSRILPRRVRPQPRDAARAERPQPGAQPNLVAALRS